MSNKKQGLDDAIQVEALAGNCAVVDVKEMVNKNDLKDIPGTVANELENLSNNKVE